MRFDETVNSPFCAVLKVILYHAWHDTTCSKFLFFLSTAQSYCFYCLALRSLLFSI